MGSQQADPLSPDLAVLTAHVRTRPRPRARPSSIRQGKVPSAARRCAHAARERARGPTHYLLPGAARDFASWVPPPPPPPLSVLIGHAACLTPY